MKQKLFSILVLLGLSATVAHAGPMGEVKKPLPILVPYVAGEAMYTWPQVKGGLNVSVPSVGTFNSTVDKIGWGGRMAGGAMHPFSEKWAGAFEFGWGYYGSFDIKPSVTLVGSGSNSASAAGLTAVAIAGGNALKTYATQYGFDILAGAYYMRPKYDLFFKAGALIQNTRTHISVNPTGLLGATTEAGSVTNRFPGVYQLRMNLVNVLPEIRLGGGYHIKKDLLATASWMHAFGRTLDPSTLGLTVNPFTVTNFSGHIYTPTIDTVLFGLEYRFT